MDDQTLNKIGAILSGLERRDRERIMKILENPPTGRTIPDLVQFLDLKNGIDELTRLVDGYREGEWEPIYGLFGFGPEQVEEFRDHYLRLHREIVSYFKRVRYGDFSVDTLDNFESIHQRIVLEGSLSGMRGRLQAKLEFYDEVVALRDQIRRSPNFRLQNAIGYGRDFVAEEAGSGEISEKIMKGVISRGNDNDPKSLHGKWLLAGLFTRQQPARLNAEKEAIDLFERSFIIPSDEEIRSLGHFIKNEDPVYCTQSYQISYSEWTVKRFAELSR